MSSAEDPVSGDECSLEVKGNTFCPKYATPEFVQQRPWLRESCFEEGMTVCISRAIIFAISSKMMLYFL